MLMAEGSLGATGGFLTANKLLFLAGFFAGPILRLTKMLRRLLASLPLNLNRGVVIAFELAIKARGGVAPG